MAKGNATKNAIQITLKFILASVAKKIAIRSSTIPKSMPMTKNSISLSFLLLNSYIIHGEIKTSLCIIILRPHGFWFVSRFTNLPLLLPKLSLGSCVMDKVSVLSDRQQNLIMSIMVICNILCVLCF